MSSIWDLLSPVHSNIYGLAFALLAATIFYFLRSRVRIIYGRANNSRNVVFSPAKDEGAESVPSEVYVEKFFLQNTGRKPASNVEFILSDFPTDIAVFEPRDTEIKRVAKEHCLIKIPQISPGELVIIDCLYINQKAAWVSSVKCAECLGREVPFWTLRRYGTLFNVSVLTAMLLGLAFIMQAIFALFIS